MLRIAQNTHVLIKSMACALSWSALWRSARIRMSAAFSIAKLVHNASSHMTFNLSNAYLSAAANKSSAIFSKFAALPVYINRNISRNTSWSTSVMSTRFCFLSSISCSNIAEKTGLRAEEENHKIEKIIPACSEGINHHPSCRKHTRTLVRKTEGTPDSTRTERTYVLFTCEDGFVRLKFPPAHRQRDVAEFLVFKQKPEVVRQSTLGNFELYGVALPGNVHAVRHHADLQHAPPWLDLLFAANGLGIIVQISSM